MRSPEELEATYQLGLKLQAKGLIRTNWRRNPEDLTGSVLLKELELIKKAKGGDLDEEGSYCIIQGQVLRVVSL